MSVVTSIMLLQSAIAHPGGWSLFKNETNCSIIASFDGDTMVRVAYTQGKDSVTVVIADPAFKSIEDDKKYDLRLVFVSAGRKLDDGWGTVKAYGMKMEKKNAVSFTVDGDDFLKDFEANTTMGLFRDDVVVASLALNGSAVASKALRSCAAQVQRANPADPFED